MVHCCGKLLYCQENLATVLSETFVRLSQYRHIPRFYELCKNNFSIIFFLTHYRITSRESPLQCFFLGGNLLVPPTWFPRAVGPVGSALSGWWHTSAPESLCPAAEKRSPPAASSSPAGAGTPEDKHLIRLSTTTFTLINIL